MATFRKISMGKAAVKGIHDAVDLVFDKAISRLFGTSWLGKRIVVGWNPDLTFKGLFDHASEEEKNKPNDDTLGSLLKIAEGYIEAQREAAKSRVHKAVDSFLNNARASGVKTDLETVLGGELVNTWSKLTSDMERIVDTESTTIRNTATLEGISKVNAALNVDDPIVYFLVTHDNVLCSECKRLHLLEDEMTPRLWKLSEIGHGYHKKGEENPKICGLHPNCRCSLATLFIGYGFKNGAIIYISKDHDEFARQRGEAAEEESEKK